MTLVASGRHPDLKASFILANPPFNVSDWGRVYEYFLSQFASAEGKKGGEFYTPRCVVKLLVEIIIHPSVQLNLVFQCAERLRNPQLHGRRFRAFSLGPSTGSSPSIGPDIN
jgi:type I restriction-modification system DNA methylase subunit